MAPNLILTTEDEVGDIVTRPDNNDLVKKDSNFKTEIVWLSVVRTVIVHILGIYGIYLYWTRGSRKLLLFAVVYGIFSGFGITAGNHRLWSHRSYKARWPLRVFLSILACIAAENDTFYWARDHRVHHKYSDTDADPHNIKRGFFFSHVGWLMCKKHPEVAAKGNTISLDDLLADPIVRFQRKFYIPMVIFFSIYLPTMIPVWCWGESAWVSFCFAAMTRYCCSLNSTWFINSAGHSIGYKPYDKNIAPRENWILAIFAVGEGFHNYHHVFPWDYATSELGYILNLTTMFIDLMAFLGLAYDLKTTTPDFIQKRKTETGDGAILYKIKALRSLKVL